MHLYC
ncbi:chitinase class I family protein, partial [Vibrio parahaemolyticus V-223/04]|jgi:U3 small nucleolar RNA-associated protein 12